MRPFAAFCLLLFAFSSPLLPRAAAQDLFDFAHSQAYARYLLQSRQHDLAIEEYERLVFMRPANDTLRGELLLALRRAGHPERALQKWADWQAVGFQPSSLLLAERARLLLAAGRADDARALVALPNFPDSSFARRADFFGLTLAQNWHEADAALRRFPPSEKLPRRADFEKLLEKGAKSRPKSAWAAVGLSAVVPGLGKAYAGQWKDGLISLMFVGMNAWQAYRRFDREGADTFWGYVHVGLGAGFYLGNLYGSHKAARKFNARQRLRLQREAQNLVLPMLD